jgi:hypothetical protein
MYDCTYTLSAGVDYEPASEEVSFPPSLEQVTSLVVNITLIDDSSITGEVKQFEASLNTSQEGVLFASDNQTATINIFDDDSKSAVTLDLVDGVVLYVIEVDNIVVGNIGGK